MKEVWKDIKSYEGIYQVSNLGRVKSLARHKVIGSATFLAEENILINVNVKGYSRVSLCKDKKVKQHSIHRLVGMAFLDNPCNLPMINHKDENKANNNVENLEWCTGKYNSNYGMANKKGRRKVYQFSLDGTFLKEWEGLTMAAKELGIDGSHISKCCIGKLKQSGNFIWKYDKEVG